MHIQVYTPKSIAVFGDDILRYEDALVALGGKYNEKLKGGAGFIFPKFKEAEVKKFIEEASSKKESIPTTSSKKEDCSFANLLDEEDEPKPRPSLLRKKSTIDTPVEKLQSALQPYSKMHFFLMIANVQRELDMMKKFVNSLPDF